VYRTLGGTKGTRYVRARIYIYIYIYILFYGKGNENYQLGTEFFVYHRVVSAVKLVVFVRHRVSCRVLRGLGIISLF